MYKIKLFLETDKTFLISISFLENHKIKIDYDKRIITINDTAVSKLRANTNLILRCLSIHEKLTEFISTNKDD